MNGDRCGNLENNIKILMILYEGEERALLAFHQDVFLLVKQMVVKVVSGRVFKT
jgi:hypothetical protein